MDHPLPRFPLYGGISQHPPDCPSRSGAKPRWRVLWDQGIPQVALESTVPPQVVRELSARGHAVQVVDAEEDCGLFGRGQILLRDGDHFIAASEPRADGLALAW